MKTTTQNTQKELKNINFLILLFYLISFISLYLSFLSPTSYAADPKLITTLNNAFEKIEKYILKLSTPAAAIAVCTGLLMKKFSFGDEEKIRTGKRLVKGFERGRRFIAKRRSTASGCVAFAPSP